MVRSDFKTRRRQRSLLVPLRILDVCTVAIAAIAAYAWYAWRYDVSFWPIPTTYWRLIVLVALGTVPVFSIVGPSIFSRGVRFWGLFREIVFGVTLLFMLVLVVLFATKQSVVFSRWWTVWWASACILFLLLQRFGVIGLLGLVRKRGMNQKKVVIVGAGQLGRSLASSVTNSVWPSFEIKSFFDKQHRAKTSNDDIPVQDDFDSLTSFVEQENIQEVWITLPLKSERLIESIVEDLLQTAVTVRFLPDIFSLRMFRHQVTEIYGFPMLDLSSSRMSGLDKCTKTILDYVVAIAVLCITIPTLFIPIAAVIRCTSKGSVFFKQLRLGWDGRPITVYKFRTMYAHSEEDGEITQATAGDVRITPIGKWLRRTSCDELPQFINVLQGRMSVVGPRPHVLEHNKMYRTKIRNYMQRHKVKPGITGFAQVRGWRGQTDTVHKMRKRVQYDLFYLENWSIGFDIKIIVLTIFRGLVHRNAY